MDAVEFAERSLLARLLHQPDVTSTLVLTPQDFRQPRHRALYAHLQALVTDPDPGPARSAAASQARAGETPTLAASTVSAVLRRTDPDTADPDTADPDRAGLDRAGLDTEPVTFGFLMRLLTEAPHPEADRGRQCRVYAELVLDEGIRRRVAESGLRITAAARSGVDVREVLDQLAQANAELTQAVTQWGYHRAHADPPPGEAAAAPPARWNGPPQVPFALPSSETTARAERDLIAHTLRDPAGLRPALAGLTEGDFGAWDMEHLFHVVTHMYRRQDREGQLAAAITPESVALRERLVTGHAYFTVDELHELASSVDEPGSPDPRTCADTVLHGRAARQIQAAIADSRRSVTTMAADPLPEVLDRVQERYLNISETLSRLDTEQARAAGTPVPPAPAPPTPGQGISTAALTRVLDRAQAVHHDADGAAPTRPAESSARAGETEPGVEPPAAPEVEG